MTNEQNLLYERVMTALGTIRDPSTGMQVVDLPLLDKLEIDKNGIMITLTPSSNVCPLIFKLGNDMKRAAKETAPDLPVRFTINNHRQKSEFEEYLSDS